VQIRRAVLDPAQRERLHRAVAGLVDKPLEPEVVHLIVEERGQSATAVPLSASASAGTHAGGWNVA